MAVFSGAAFTFGVERHVIDGIPVRVYSAAKTVADCFKFRSKVGLDVALEALREGLRAKRVSRDSVWAAAKVCRVTSVIRPYLEAI
jgi:predicted transcriptional regulator of viral defense system